MKVMKLILRFGIVLILFGSALMWAASESGAAYVDPNAFVYIMNMGIVHEDASGQGLIQYSGLRNGFAVGNGQYIVTAAHCLTDFENSNQVLREPLVISPYYGDVFGAEIVAIDEKNDIAVLKPTWAEHPALELESADRWKTNKVISITGYPPPDKERGGNENLSRQILSEDVPLKGTSGKDKREIMVGPVHYPGVGWSGSPFINPETGKVLGVFCRYDTYESKRYFFFKKKEILHSGPGIESVRQLLNDNHLSCGVTPGALPNLDGKRRFNRILGMLDMLISGQDKESQHAVKYLCNDMPDSAILHIIGGWIFDTPEDCEYYQKAVETTPDNALVRAAYGDYLAASNKHQQAAEQFHRVVKSDPNHVFACHGQLSALVKTDPNRAVLLGRELTERRPENAGFCFEYSRALRAKKNHTEELTYVRKAVELSETVPFLYQRHLADSLKANKRYEEADKAYTKLLKTHECEHCWSAYTSLLLKMGRAKADQAKEAFEKTKSFSQDPNAVSKTYHDYEIALERLFSDPNMISEQGEGLGSDYGPEVEITGHSVLGFLGPV